MTVEKKEVYKLVHNTISKEPLVTLKVESRTGLLYNIIENNDDIVDVSVAVGKLAVLTNFGVLIVKSSKDNEYYNFYHVEYTNVESEVFGSKFNDLLKYMQGSGFILTQVPKKNGYETQTSSQPQHTNTSV